VNSFFFKITAISFCFLEFTVVVAQSEQESLQSIYPKKNAKKTHFYDFLWGKHYRELYSLDISVKQPKDTVNKKLSPLVKGFPYFKYFDDFEKKYDKERFQGTYSDSILTNAYTIIHPLSFVIANKLAENINLYTGNNQLFYQNETFYKSAEIDSSFLSTQEIIKRLEEDSTYKIDEKKYVRSRLLDMIIGNALEVNNSYLWKNYDKNLNIYYPYKIDRGFSFVKKDGLLYDVLLHSIGIKNIPNYYKKRLNPYYINAHNYSIDLTFSDRINEQTWLEEAKFIKSKLTDAIIDKIFAELPNNFQNTESTIQLKKMLLYKIDNIELLAKKYHQSLQKNAIIRGTSQNDTFEIIQNQDNTVIIVKNSEGKTILKNEYQVGKTREIWLYGFRGTDVFTLQKNHKNNIVIRIINEGIDNKYELKNATDKTKVYVQKDVVLTKKDLGNARIFKITNSAIFNYSQDRPKNNTFAFYPSVLLDTDLKFRLGGNFTYTRNQFKTYPFSAKHRFSFTSYSLSYSGIFPNINQKHTYTTDIWYNLSNDFQNFFGFGNETQNYQTTFGISYNRVFLQRIGAETGIVFNLSQTQKTTIKVGVENFDVVDQYKFYSAQPFEDTELTSNVNTFMNTKVNHHISSEHDKENNFGYTIIPEVGLITNPKYFNKSIPYLSGYFSFRFHPTVNKKYTFETNIHSKSLFNNTFEFFQAVALGGKNGLRGYRDDRFSGQHYLVHSTDFKINVGDVTNKIIPFGFEPFVGFDYGRVWITDEKSRRWHTSFGGGIVFKIVNVLTANMTYFISSEKPRTTFWLGYSF